MRSWQLPQQPSAILNAQFSDQAFRHVVLLTREGSSGPLPARPHSLRRKTDGADARSQSSTTTMQLSLMPESAVPDSEACGLDSPFAGAS